MITILETNKPIFKNQCNHRKKEYQFTIVISKGKEDTSIGKRYYDVYLFKNFEDVGFPFEEMKVCLRYGDEAAQYRSLDFQSVMVSYLKYYDVY